MDSDGEDDPYEVLKMIQLSSRILIMLLPQIEKVEKNQK